MDTTVWISFSLSSPLPTLQVVPVTRMSRLLSSATALSTLAWRRLLTTTWAPLDPRACAAASPILGRRKVCVCVWVGGVNFRMFDEAFFFTLCFQYIYDFVF